MSEIRDLMGIYGEIDRALLRDPERRAPVARFFPFYRDADAQWFDEFEAWIATKRVEGSREALFPSLEEALQNLAFIETQPRPRMRARRLFAIAVTVWAFREIRDGGDLADLAAAALSVEGIAGDDERARALLDLIGQESLFPPLDEADPRYLRFWWETLLGTAAEHGLLTSLMGMRPRPCTGKLVTVDLPWGSDVVAALMTQFDTQPGEIAFDAARRFLAPKNWPGCSDFWCQMKKIGVSPKGADQYHEIVSTACPVWTIDAYLDFTFIERPGVAITNYVLSEGHPKAGDDVLVDEGTLIVQQISAEPRLRITTTKRIKFNYPFDGGQLAMIMCPLGYASVVEDLVFSCAATEPKGGSPFPGKAPPIPGKGAYPDLGAVIAAVADSVKECVDDCANAYQASYKKIGEGEYGADALVQDMAAAWSRTMRDSAAAVDLRTRAAARRPPTD